MTPTQSPDAAPAEWPDERKAQRRLTAPDMKVFGYVARDYREFDANRRVKDLGNSGHRVVTTTLRALASVGALRVPENPTDQATHTPHCLVEAMNNVSLVEPAPAALAGDEAQIAEIEKRHEMVGIDCNAMHGIGAGAKYFASAHHDRSTLLRLLKSRQPAPTREQIEYAVAPFVDNLWARDGAADAILALWEEE